MGLFARCHCVDTVLRQLHVIPFINHFPDYLISALVAEVEVLAFTGTTGSREQLLGEDDMRQLEEQRIHSLLQLPLQSGTFQPLPFPAASTVNLVGEMLGDELFLRDLTTFVHCLLTVGNGFGDIPVVSLDSDYEYYLHVTNKKHKDEGEHPNKKTEIKMVLKNPVTLLCMSSNCNAKYIKIWCVPIFGTDFYILLTA